MNEHPLPPAVTGAEMRLDALLAELRAVRDLLTPVAPAPAPEPEPEIVELREPEPELPMVMPSRRRRR